jgi:RHH-type rel operon transcriptional repressor/antitoxin RelB
MATSVRLPENIEQRLNFLAKKTGRTKAYFIREIISSGIDEMEDYYLAAGVIERVHKGKEKIFTADEVRKELAMLEKPKNLVQAFKLIAQLPDDFFAQGREDKPPQERDFK